MSGSGAETDKNYVWFKTSSNKEQIKCVSDAEAAKSV